MPLESFEDVERYVAVKSSLKLLHIYASGAERVRLYQRCAALGLREQRINQGLDLIYYYIYSEGNVAKAVAVGEDVASNLDAIDSSRLATAYNLLGNVRLGANDYAKATAYYLLSYEAAKYSYDELKDRVYALGNLGHSYAESGDTTLARQALLKSAYLTNQLDDAKEVAYNNVYDFAALARLLTINEDKDSADTYLQLARNAVGVHEQAEPRYVEVMEEYLEAAVAHALDHKRFELARLQLDTLSTLSPEKANYFRAQLLKHQGETEEAFALVSQGTYDDERIERQRVELLIELAESLQDYGAGFAQLQVRLKDSELETQQMRNELTSLSESLVVSFDAQLANTAQRHADELEVYRARQRSWISVVVILASLSLSIFLYARYRRSSERVGSLNALVSTHERDLERMNSELRKRIEAMERYNHLLSHDLREPMRSINGFAKLLGRELSLSGQTSTHYKFLARSIAQLETLMAGVEALRVVEDRVAVLEQVDVGLVLRKCIREVKTKYPAANIRLDAHEVTALTDRYLLNVIITQLLDNACKFNEAAAATVHLTVRQSTDTLTLLIADDGIGMEDEYHEQVFDVFQRLNRREDYPGAGIGLALVRVAAAKLSAKVTIDSPATGTGCEVQVSIPVLTAKHVNSAQIAASVG